MNWATDVVWGNPDRGVVAFDPVAWLDGHGVKHEEGAGAFVNLLLQDDLAACALGRAPRPEHRRRLETASDRAPGALDLANRDGRARGAQRTSRYVPFAAL